LPAVAPISKIYFSLLHIDSTNEHLRHGKGGVDAWPTKYCNANNDVVVAGASLCRSGGIAIAAIR
jgi:hypothetical protein